MSKIAVELKKEWIEMSDVCFEPLTFGELEVGQKFISLPCPGDNSGHGGLRNTHYIFTKTDQLGTRETQYGQPTFTNNKRAVNNRGAMSDFPDSMLVIKVG